MQCQNCKKHTATIHLTEIVDGNRSEAHLCEMCAQKQGVAVKAQIPLNELLSTLLSSKSQSETNAKTPSSVLGTKKCPHCGITFEQFSKQSLLGCPYDYEVFQDALLPIIKKSHDNNVTHMGKVPSKANANTKLQAELLTLRKKLDAAIKSEDYETAAKLRDRISQLK